MPLFRRYISPNAHSLVKSEARNRFTLAIEGNGQVDKIIRDGINAYTYYLEQQILSCVASSGAVLEEIFGPIPPPPGDRVSQLFDILVVVSEILHTLDPKSSLNDIAQSMLAKTKHLRVNKLDRVQEDQSLRGEHHVVFACLGWLSMLFIPLYDFSTPNFRFWGKDSSAIMLQDIDRPVGNMLRRMGLLPISCPATPATAKTAVQSAPFMKLSVLCYSSLHHIGEISILWVNNLAEHCHFDPERQELKLFRFPAYCIYAIRGAPDIKILKSILGAHTCSTKSCERDLPGVVQAYLREVLLSYRVIFGQEKKSRKLFRSRESFNSRFCFVEDPILQVLCGRKRTSIVTDYLTMDSEKEVFDSRIDFPHLGEKLLRLHHYNANQKPSAWRAILLDRRDSRESFNFYWTVVVVGGITITLSLIQTIVEITGLIKGR